MANPGLNALIIGVLLFGIVYVFRQVINLYPEINWVGVRIADPVVTVEKAPVLLAPMATMLRDRTDPALATGSMRRLLRRARRAARDHALSRRPAHLPRPARQVSAVGDRDVRRQHDRRAGHDRGENVMLFDQLKEGLAGPLKGMGTAFSCSMFGLAAPLILGFLDLQAGHAQSRFYNELEDWLSGITELQSAETAGAGVPPTFRFALIEMQRSPSDLNDKVEMKVLNDPTGTAVKDLAQGVDKLIRDARRAEGRARMGRRDSAQQQHELAAVLKQITDKSKASARGQIDMALVRGRRERYAANYWPAVSSTCCRRCCWVTFLMALFMLTNYIITQAASGKDTMLSRLSTASLRVRPSCSRLKIEEAIGRGQPGRAAGYPPRQGKGEYAPDRAARRCRRQDARRGRPGDLAHHPAQRAETDHQRGAGQGRDAEPAACCAPAPTRGAAGGARSLRGQGPRKVRRKSPISASG